MSGSAAALAARVTIDRHLEDGEGHRALAEDALDGLTRPFKELPPKHFYDARGSELFEQICTLPEYYPTRTEMGILEAQGAAAAAASGAAELVELGSGATAKARILLDGMASGAGAARYVPFDVAEGCVRAAGDELVADYPGLQVHGVVGDFERHLPLIPGPGEGGARLVAFLGGTIGNFAPGSRRRFLRSLAALLRPADALILGIDLVKDPAELEAAYDDGAGVTAEFNRNVLHVLNRELGADFVPAAFDHVAFFDREHEWIEMRLRAREACAVRLEAIDLGITFAAGEEVRTEISAKFTRARIEADLAAAGLAIDTWMTDPDRRFAVLVAKPRA
ncbi:MAG: L-histidine N(alpha)-methyltransferase [Solirubrobacteraceae bacterium]